MTDKRIKAWFNTYNLRHFNSRLPKDTVVEWSTKMVKHAIERVHVHGKSRCSEWGCEKSFIRLHPDMQKMEAVALMTLLHAMVHLDGNLTHGPGFQNEMKRLAAKGAFRDLW